MGNEGMEVVVFSDQDGNYYALPRQTLEQARVPTEHKGEVEKLVRQGEVVGYADEDTPALEQIGKFSAPSGLQMSNMQASWSPE
jgi:hypothetical protein